jgi:hypothetical protein
MQDSKKFIVITSIFDPTPSVRAFSQRKDYTTVVVGDKKTNTDWHCDNVVFLSVEAQNEMDFSLKEMLPYDHYCRKMMGYLYSMAQGAGTIIDTDDDNMPEVNWDFPAPEGHFSGVPGDQGFVNIYRLYTHQPVWPRGLPLDRINKTQDLEQQLTTGDYKIGIWQGLANGDPDVDAIYRLTNDTPCYFTERPPVVLGKNTMSPFNSQNTRTRKELFPLLYLPAFVSIRFTDILRGLVAQPIMWLYDYHLGFTNATVVQQRNPHDYFKDFIDEIPMYRHAGEVIDIVKAAVSEKYTIGENLFLAYSALEKKDIVPERELLMVKAWLKDLERMGS